VSNRSHEHRQSVRQVLQVAPFDWIGQLRCHWIAIVVLVAHVGLATLYSVAVPIWEAYDEVGHYEYARYIATKRTLPQRGDPEAKAMWEKFQPPLYYLLAGASMSWIDVSDDLKATRNPYFTWGTSGVNYAIHPDSERFPYGRTVLAVHVIRLLSVAMSTVGVLLTYLTGLVIAPQRRWIGVGAMAIHAFWPQFLFIGSMVTNDVLAATMGSLITFVVVRIVQRGARGLQLMALGVSLGLALLSKANTLALFPIAAAVLIAETMRKLGDVARRKDWRWWIWLVLSLLVVALAFLALSNVSFVGIPGIWRRDKPSGVGGVIQGISGITEILAWSSFGDAFRYCAKSFYALFGWGNVEVAGPLYPAHALLVALALVGLVTMLVRRQLLIARPALLVCAAVILALLVLVLATAARANNVFYANGRYLLPGMSAFSIVVFTGWAAPWPVGTGKPLALIAAVAMFAIALVIPFCSIMPAYARPRLLSQEEVETLASPLEARFDHVAELLGYRISSRRPKPGRRIGVVLYWRALRKPSKNYTVRVEIVGPDGQGYGSDAGYPANGNFATSLWKPGDIFEDAGYLIRISDEFPAPAKGLITVALVGEDIDPLGANPDEELTLVRNPVPLQEIGVYSPSGGGLCDDVVATSYELGGQIVLVGYSFNRLEQPEESIGVTLCWRAIAQMDEDYIVFVHLRDSAGELVSQHDSPPRQGYYPTLLWAPGDMVADEHYLNVAPQCLADDCEIYVGMYNLETLERLQVLDERGGRVANDEIPLD